MVSSPAGSWQATDQEAIRQCLALPATVPCLDAISRTMADLERQHPAGVLSARALLDAVALIDQQQSRSGPITGSVAASGDAPLQKADVIAYDTSLLREETETVYATPRSPAAGLLSQRRRYADQLLLLLPALASWVRQDLGQPFVSSSSCDACTAKARCLMPTRTDQKRPMRFRCSEGWRGSALSCS